MNFHRTMIAAIAALFLMTLLPPDLGGPSVATAIGCLADQQDLTTGGNKLTNTAQATGSQDSQYHLSSAPVGVTSTDAWVIPTLTGAWATPASYANWVNPWSATSPYSNNGQPGGTTSGPGSASLNGATPYSYYTTFTLSTLPYDHFEIDIDFAADDFVNVLLNGQEIGTAGVFTTSNGFNQKHHLQWTADSTSLASQHFQVGTNTLTFNVINWIVYTGLLVEGTFTQSCDVPCPSVVSAPLIWDITTGVLKSSAPNTPSVNLLYGAPDNLWYLEKKAGVATPSHPNPNAVAPQVSPDTWVVPAVGKWISPGGGLSNSAASTLAGEYIYSLPVDVGCYKSDCSKTRLEFTYAAAKDVKFYLNGQLIETSGSPSFSEQTPFAMNGCSFPGGIDTSYLLTAIVQNPNPEATGLLLEGSLTLQ